MFVSAIALFLNFFSTIRGIRGQKISNYQEIVKSHREIWKLYLANIALYGRTIKLDVDLVAQPISEDEAVFVRLLFLHMTSAFAFAKRSHMLQIKKLEYDFAGVLSLPIPRNVWHENRIFYNNDFVRFVEKAKKQKNLFDHLPLILRKKSMSNQLWKVLVLSAHSKEISGIIERLGDEVIYMTDAEPPIDKEYIEKEGINFIVTFGYGQIIKSDVLKKVKGINIHLSLLPLNRGYNPHLWAWVDDTTKGVTIHYLDEGIDTGDILFQREITELPEGLSLQSSYDFHVQEAIELFSEKWCLIRADEVSGIKQSGKSTYYDSKSQKVLEEILTDEGLDLPIEDFVERAKVLLETS